jgi:hypothetical protein
MCLADRASELERLDAGRFEGQGQACRLTYPSSPQAERFRCGELLIGLRPETDWMSLRAIRVAANGEWTRIAGTVGPLSARLRVEPGTERSAIRNVIFHPMILWVELNHTGGTPIDP